MTKPVLEWIVCIKDESNTLRQIAEVDTEPRAQLFVSALREAGAEAIHFKQEVEF